ncbi:MAG TPA: TlpA disulfide reductase family protein [Verrucomicrobiae bacterium]|jgi:thiol-disulfide isomerase/thioredoxin|nr:TlpA disulfide reductase family protein [Verrucomicrobiae bacterium]
MTKRFILLCSLLIVLSSAGEQLKLPMLKVGETTYTNVTILGANTTDLYFSHSQGFANVKLKYVSKDLQKRFDYNPKAAEEAERKQNEADILYQSTLAQTVQSQRSDAAAASAKTPAAVGAETGLADPASDRSLIGKTQPKLEVDKWIGEKPSLEGKYVLISFWATWSAPSRQWISEFNAMQKKYADKLAIIGVSTESENTVNEQTEPRLEYASAIDSKAKLSAAAGVVNIPSVLLCDPKGVVLYQGHPAALTDKKLQAIFSRQE